MMMMIIITMTIIAFLFHQLSKFKRLLTLSRQRLEENQRQLMDKNATIERLTNEIDVLQRKLQQGEEEEVDGWVVVVVMMMMIKKRRSHLHHAASAINMKCCWFLKTPHTQSWGIY